MPSRSYQHRVTVGASALDEIEAAHRAVGGAGPGRRTATQQINYAYAMLLSAQFQRFCRDLHSECVDILASAAGSPTVQQLFRTDLLLHRRLDRGNPNPGNVS